MGSLAFLQAIFPQGAMDFSQWIHPRVGVEPLRFEPQWGDSGDYYGSPVSSHRQNRKTAGRDKMSGGRELQRRQRLDQREHTINYCAGGPAAISVVRLHNVHWWCFAPRNSSGKWKNADLSCCFRRRYGHSPAERFRCIAPGFILKMLQRTENHSA